MSGFRAARSAFGSRLAITVVLTTATLGAAQYQLAGRALTDRVLAHDLDGHGADADVLASLHRPASPEPLAEVSSLLGHMASRPGVTSAALVDRSGEVLLSGHAHGAPPAGGHSDLPASDVAAPGAAEQPLGHVDVWPALTAASSGRPSAQRLPAQGLVVHAVPVDLAGVRHVLLVVRSDAPLQTQVAGVRRVLLTTLALGALLALPLFFLVGGRGLTQRHRRAVDASTRDGLTGLGNHRWFHERLAETVAATTRTGESGCLALIDLDGFKQVNDSAGHRRGDEVLARVARVLLAAGPGRAFRVGGDEFALLLPGTLLDAGAVAEAVRAQVALLGLGVTTSIGVAPVVPGSTAQPLWDAADAALYTAKRAGRNRVVVDGSVAALAPA